MRTHSEHVLLVLLASVSIASCNSNDAASPDSGPSDASTDAASMSDMTPEDADLLDAGDMFTPTDASMSDATVEDAGACVDPPSGPPVPSDVPSRQTVTFHVTGSGYLGVRSGIAPCNPFSIFSGTTEIDQVGGLQVLCEGPLPPSPTVSRYMMLGEYDLEWDARQLVSYTTAYDCAAHGWPGAGCQRERHDVHQPVDAGHYRVRVAVDDVLPGSCTEVGDAPGFFACSDFGSGGPPPFGSTPTTCPTGRTFDVEFDLPESGDIVVNVVVPAP